MVTKEIEKRIDEWIDSHVDEYINDLAKIIAVPSVASMGVAEGEYPFGKGSADALAKAKEMAEGYGFSVENMDNFCLVARVGGGDEKVGILGHLDVVPVGDDWKFPPFALTKFGDGMIAGRGVLDDKGPLWASVYSVRCLKELGLLPKRQIEIFMGGDEECGMEDVKHYREFSEKLPVVAFTPDGNYPICHGEKGAVRFTFEIPKEKSNVISFIGGTVRNVVADHAELVLSGADFEAAKEKLSGNERITVEKDGDNVKITATGAAVHASMPENGINAIGIAANAALEAGLLNEEGKKAAGFIAMVLSDYYGKAIGVPFEDEPSGKLTHVGGVIKTNGDTLSLSIDIRFPVTCNADVIADKIAETTAPYGVTMANIQKTNPIYAPADSDIIRMSMETINSVFHREHWKPYTMGGGTYAKKMDNAFALGPEDPDFESPFGPFRGSIHQDDECTSIKLLIDTMKVYARLLINLDDLTF